MRYYVPAPAALDNAGGFIAVRMGHDVDIMRSGSIPVSNLCDA